MPATGSLEVCTLSVCFLANEDFEFRFRIWAFDAVKDVSEKINVASKPLTILNLLTVE